MPRSPDPARRPFGFTLALAGFLALILAAGAPAPGSVPSGADRLEIGANDFRISDMGNTDGDANFDARSPGVAYSPMTNEYLVAWRGNDETGSLDPNEFEIFGQRIDAATGGEVGANDFRISTMGGDGDNNLEASSAPAIAYNSTDNEYLVVWAGDDINVNAEEIHGQRVSATGALLGGNFRISSMGADDTNGNARAFDPAVAYNATDNEYLVVWRGDDQTGSMVDNENEIWGQRLTAAGAETGTDDFRISDMGGADGSADFIAQSPAVAYNGIDNQYLVVWNGEEADDENEIYAQRLSSSGSEVGSNDFRISQMGPDGDGSWDAFADLDVAYNGVDNEYLVVWRGDDDRPGLANGEGEIYGQRVSNVGAEVGIDDFRISDMGPDGDTATQAEEPVVVYLSATNRYLVLWRGQEIEDDREIHGQRLAANGSEDGPNDFRISDIDGSGTSSRSPDPPRVAYASALGHAIGIWAADDPDSAALADNEFEIFGQRLAVGAIDFFIADRNGSEPMPDPARGLKARE